MKILKEIRGAYGISQRNLARKAGVSFRCIQQLESVRHNWRVDSLRQVAEALGLPGDGLDYYLQTYLSMVPDSVPDVSLRMHLDGFDSWKTHLLNFVDRFRASRNPQLVDAAPIEELDNRLRGLVASTTEVLCHECDMTVPPWTRGVPALPQPWFVAGVENLKAMALVESPATYRARNIFVLGNFLSRA